ncbi:MAG: hypothetical protein R3208_19925 [Ketobacteraceae bacterium]|nr:hypothetical protein [Ketobacteraceae bacterium]
MAEIYLTPGDISASDTRIVLAFLNAMQSAEEIAARVEIPNELDIGVRLGQRILDAREQLGGRFSDLQQLMEVPLIGPERFTEVVTEALDKSALDILSRRSRSRELSEIAAVSSQIDVLRASLKELEVLNPNRYRIEIKSLDSTPYLGEVIPVRIRVWDRHTRKYKANMPLTIETNWGNLRWSRGLQVKQGAVIHGRTSVSGELVVELYTPTVEPLTVPQQTELSLALGKLSHQAEVPSQARQNFQELTAKYQHPLNVDLRKAMDIHYKSRQDRVAESINSPSSVYQWTYEQALVRAYAHPREAQEQNTVISLSTLVVEYRDWLSPWYDVYKNDLVESQSLQTGLNEALNFSDDEQGVVGHMVSSLHSFIAHQNGLLGARVGQQAGKEVVTRMLSQDPQFLSSGTKETLYTVLNQAPGTITPASKGSVGIANEVAIDVGRNTGLFDIVDADINFDQLTSRIEAFNSNYQNFTSEYTQFNDDFAAFNQEYQAFNTDYQAFNTNYADFSSQYGTWQNDYVDFQDSLADFNVAKDQLIQNVTVGVNDALRNVEATITGTTGTSVAIDPIENVTIGRNIHRPGGGG